MIKTLVGIWLIVMAISAFVLILIDCDIGGSMKSTIISLVTLGLELAVAEFGFWLIAG